MKYYIKKNERGLLFQKGDYIKCLQPGEYSFLSFLKYEVIIVDINKPFHMSNNNLELLIDVEDLSNINKYDLELFIHDEQLLGQLDIIDINDNEIALHYIDGKLTNIYESGKYAFWNVHKKNYFEIFDMKTPYIDDNIDPAIFHSPVTRKYIYEINVEPYEKAVLFYNNSIEKILEPGKYYYWTKYVHITSKKIDMRQNQIDMTGQEIMTADKVTLRLNFVCQYKITDVLKATLEIKNYENQLYILLQLILREYIGTIKLDDLLKMKQEISDYVLARLKEKESEMGIEFIYAGIKDVILPGEIKDILNTVLLAEKRAQANVITRREEIASTRSLLNTAKLMDENKTLYKLKELEHLEKICEKIGNISVNGGGNILENLHELFA
ncbi:MAG: slipin family protein [Vallitalea sp.]|jgi:regulator of protease activity HflC (stomatin/prohibitin superfamily)|nr:slipin family protein [Vallitalea sp.]